MATIPNQATGLRHARKTIAFDGGAGNGAVGTVAVFATTGRVLVDNITVYCSESLVDAGGVTPASLDMGVAADVDFFSIDSGPLAPADALVAGSWWETWTGTGSNPGAGGARKASGWTWSISSDFVLNVNNEAITDGTLIIDVWYLPITDDGALAGDDIDLELGAYLADKVLDEALSGHTAAGSAGKAISDIETDVDAVLVDTGTTLQAELDGIQADTEDIQSRLPAALVGGRIDATIDATGMEAGAVDAILDEVVEGSYTFRQYLRLFASALGAKLAGAATTTVTIQDVGDTKARITATVDADGNRSAVTLDLT